MKMLLETAPVEAAKSAISWRSAKAGGPARPCISWTWGRSGSRLYQYGSTCLASAHCWLQHSPRLQPHLQRTQAAVSRTRPPPLAAPGGTGRGHRAGDHVGSAAGAVAYQCRRRSVRQQHHQGVRGGLGVGGEAAAGAAVLGAATALATAGAAAAEAVAAMECPAAATSAAVGSAAVAEGTG